MEREIVRLLAGVCICALGDKYLWNAIMALLTSKVPTLCPGRRLNGLFFGWPPERLAAWEKVQDKFYNNVLFGAFLIYPISSLNSLQAFNCHSSLGVIMVDFRMSCPPVFSFMGLYSLACFLAFPLGIPFVFWSLLVAMKVPDVARDKIVKAGLCAQARLNPAKGGPTDAQVLMRRSGGPGVAPGRRCIYYSLLHVLSQAFRVYSCCFER